MAATADPISHVLRRPKLLRWIIGAALVLVTGTATVVSGYTLHRVAAVEREHSHDQRRMDWMATTIWYVAQKVGVTVAPPPKGDAP